MYFDWQPLSLQSGFIKTQVRVCSVVTNSNHPYEVEARSNITSFQY